MIPGLSPPVIGLAMIALSVLLFVTTPRVNVGLPGCARGLYTIGFFIGGIVILVVSVWALVG